MKISSKSKKIFEKALAKAKGLDAASISKIIESATKKVNDKPSALSSARGDLMTLIRMVKASTKGIYTQVPWQTIATAIAAIIYFVNPFDAISDFIPGVGFIDDMTVLAWAIKSIKVDIDKFIAWEKLTPNGEADVF